MITYTFTPADVVEVSSAAGVFEIRDAQGKSLMVGTADSLRMELLRILANPQEHTKLFGLKPREVAVEYLGNPQTAEMLKAALIAQNRPRAQS